LARETDHAILKSYAKTISIAVVVALGIRFFLIEAYRIPTPAMRPTLEIGDTIFVAKWPFGLRTPGAITPFNAGRAPEIGEVVVFSDPVDSSRDYIKRVVAVPGDRVEVRGGKLIINDKALEVTAPQVCGTEVLTNHQTHGVCFEQPIIEDSPAVVVPPKSVFVIGDFRSKNPVDAEVRRSWGIIPMNVIKGKALWIWMSIEPPSQSNQRSFFPQFRFYRMFRRVE
jgi:signal peptidase I